MTQTLVCCTTCHIQYSAKVLAVKALTVTPGGFKALILAVTASQFCFCLIFVLVFPLYKVRCLIHFLVNVTGICLSFSDFNSFLIANVCIPLCLLLSIDYTCIIMKYCSKIQILNFLVV